SARRRRHRPRHPPGPGASRRARGGRAGGGGRVHVDRHRPGRARGLPAVGGVTTIGVNLLWCVPGRVGGSEEYVTRALAPLPAAAPELEVVLFALPGFAAAHPEVAAL